MNYLDLNLIGDRVQANPAAYGLQSPGASTAADVAAGRADNFLFYADNVHLSSAGFAIVGAYAVRQLEAPLHLEAQVDTVLHSAESFGQALEDRLDLGSADEGDGPPLRLFLTGDYGQRTRDDTLTSLEYRTVRTGGTIGLEYDGGQWLVGAAVNLSNGESDMRTGTGSVASDALQFGAYASWSNGNAFIEAYGGVGRADLDIRRDAIIDEIRGAPDAETMIAGAQVGYLMDFGQLKIGPVLGIAYARARIDAFTETGDQVLTLNVREQEDDQLVASAGLELNGSSDIGGGRFSPYLTAVAEKELESDPRTILYAATAAPGIVNRWTVGGGSDDPYARITGGANFSITRAVTLQVAAGTTVGQDGGDSSSASVAVRVGF